MQRAWFGFVTARLLAAPNASLAVPISDPPVELTWDAPMDCPPREAVLNAVTRLLGEAREPRVAVRARVTVGREDDRQWHAEVALDGQDAQSKRSFDAESCNAIASAAALIIAVALDGRIARSDPAADERKTRTGSTAGTRPSHKLLFAPGPEPSPLDGSLAVAIDRILPGLAPGGEIGLGWSQRYSTWSLRASLAADLFVPQVAEAPTAERATFWLFATSGRVCASPRFGVVDIGPCIGGEVDGVWASAAEGRSPFVSQLRGGAFVTLLGSVLGTVNLSRRTALFARVDVLVPLARPEFVIDRPVPLQPATLYQPPTLTAGGAVGLMVRFF